jgi:hypothetical protein
MDDKIDFLRGIYSHELPDGKTLLESTEYMGTPMWWTADLLFFQFLGRTINEESGLKRLNQNKLLIIFFKHRSSFISLYKSIGIYIEILYDFFIFLAVKLINTLFGRGSKDSSKKKVMFISQDRQWGYVKDYRTFKSEKTDAFFDPVLKNLTRYDLKGFYPIDVYPHRGLKVFLDKKRKWKFDHVPLNFYWTLDSWKKQEKAIKSFENTWKLILEDDSFKKACIFHGKDLYPAIMGELELYFFILFPHIIKYLEMARTMIKDEDPSLIILLNEFWWWERSLMMAAKSEGVKTVALQHGVILPRDRSYQYNEDEILPKPYESKLKCPIPDKTVVYGSYYRDLLMNTSSFPKDSVLDLGQPRYDVLAHVNSIYSKKEFPNKFGIPEGNKIVLWTTQSFSLGDDEDTKNIHCIFKTLETMNKTTLIIKQHPMDGTEYKDKILRISKSYKTDFRLVPRDSDTYEQIYNCDLMIVKNSTTALEAVALNKPVIVLNLSGNHDAVDYVDKKVALGVYKEDDLENAVKSLLENDSLNEYRERYVEEHLHAVDGRSSVRIAELVERMIDGDVQ